MPELGGHPLQHADSLARDFHADPVTWQNKNV